MPHSIQHHKQQARAPHKATSLNVFWRTNSMVAASLALTLMLPACTEPVSWQKLLAARISQNYPAYKPQPTADGQLLVERPGLASTKVDVTGIAAFCLRGPKDCDYATSKMLLELGEPSSPVPTP